MQGNIGLFTKQTGTPDCACAAKWRDIMIPFVYQQVSEKDRSKSEKENTDHQYITSNTECSSKESH